MMPEVILLWAAATFGQVPPTQPVPKLMWDEVRLNVLGQPTTIKDYDVALVPVPLDLRNEGAQAVRILKALPTEFAGYAVAPLLNGVPPGAYRFQVRARDAAATETADLVSQWSEPASPPPAVVQGLRVVVQVQVTVEQQ